MHLPPLFLASMGLVGVISGRLLFGRWFNHLSLYSLVWGMGLTLFELGWIKYTPLTIEAWMMIGYAWVAFAAGSIILLLARASLGLSFRGSSSVIPEAPAAVEKKILVTATIVLSAIALIGVIKHWSIVLGKFGSVSGVLLNGATIYRLRTAGKLGGLPYVDSLVLAAACFAGIYCGRIRSMKPLALLPIGIVLADEIAMAARAKLLVAALLFLSAYWLTKLAPSHLDRFRSTVGKSSFATLIALLALLIIGAELIRNIREVTRTSFYGMTSKFEKHPYIPPTIYLYLSAHPGTFSAYLKAGGEQSFPGTNTLTPLFRILGKLGIADPPPLYPRFYNVPIAINTATYLHEIYADFGVPGILTLPYLLGMICTIIWIRLKQRFHMLATIWLAHLYVVVIYTYLVQGTQLGFWLVSLLISLLVGTIIDRRCRAKLAKLKP